MDQTGPKTKAPGARLACPDFGEAMGEKTARGQLMRPYGHLMRGGRIVLIRGGQIVLVPLATDALDRGAEALG